MSIEPCAHWPVCKFLGKDGACYSECGYYTAESKITSHNKQSVPLCHAVELLSKALGELSSYENAPSDVIGYVEDAWSLLKGK